jgi:SAM-dependent methyltransferase
MMDMVSFRTARPTLDSMLASEEHYDDVYFAYQRRMGAFGGWAELPKFVPHITHTDRVVDFGCGGGYLLEHLQCAEKIGIEVNPAARAEAAERGITTVDAANALEDDWADVVISNHALEHCPHPLVELQGLYRALKADGLIVFVVPCESVGLSYDPANQDRHLYSWSPMSLANLFCEAGFHVVSSEPYRHRWPPGYRTIARITGRRGFDFAAHVYARLRRDVSQVKLIGRRAA